MPIDVTRSRHPCEAVKGMDRTGAVGVCKVGGRPIGHYLTFGEYGRLCIAAADVVACLKSPGGA